MPCCLLLFVAGTLLVVCGVLLALCPPRLAPDEFRDVLSERGYLVHTSEGTSWWTWTSAGLGLETGPDEASEAAAWRGALLHYLNNSTPMGVIRHVVVD